MYELQRRLPYIVSYYRFAYLYIQVPKLLVEILAFLVKELGKIVIIFFQGILVAVNKGQKPYNQRLGDGNLACALYPSLHILAGRKRGILKHPVYAFAAVGNIEALGAKRTPFRGGHSRSCVFWVQPVRKCRFIMPFQSVAFRTAVAFRIR